MGRGTLLSLVALWLCGLAGIGGLWWAALSAPPPRAERAAARAVAGRLEGFVEDRAQVVRELAERFGGWESLPEAAVADALRSAATRHLELGRLVVADPAGRLIAGYDAGQPLGRETLPPGGLDPVLARRDALREGGAVLVLPEAQAGALLHLELGAAIRRGDGTRPGYVGATLGLGPLRRELAALSKAGLRLGVSTAAGHVLFPCRGQPPRAGARAASPRFVVRVAAERGRAPRRLGVPALSSLLVLASLLLGTRAFTRLDRARQIGNPDGGIGTRAES